MNDEFQNRIDTAKAEIMAKVEDTQERQSTIIEAVVLSGAEEHKSAICTMQDSIDTLQKEMKMFHDAQNNISSRVEVMEKIILGPMPRNAKSPQDKDASSEPSGMHNPGALPSPIRKIDHTLIATRMHGTATQQHSVDLVKFDRDLGNTSETCSGQAKNMSALWEALSELELLRAEMHKVVRLQDTLKCDQETSHIALRNLRRNQPSITSRLTAIGHAQDILTTNFKDYAGYISTSLENSKLHTNHLHTELSAQQDRDKTDRASLHQRMDMLDKRLDKFEQRNRDAARLQLQLLVSHVPQACPPEPQPTARTRRETTSCPLPTPLLQTESDAPPALREVPTQDRDQQSVQTRQQPPPPFPSPPPQFPNQQLQQHAQKQGHQQPLLAPDTKASQTPGPQRQNHPLQPLQYHGSSVPQPALHNVPVIDLGRFLKSIQH